MTVLSMEELGLLGANVYVVTSDLHKSCRNLANRLNYVKEVKYVEDTINGLAIKLNKKSVSPSTNLSVTVNTEPLLFITLPLVEHLSR